MSASSTAGPGPAVVDVGDADFAREVLERSRELPVIVDFWAPWCGPCRQLGPALERSVEAQGGAVRLAKVNVDQSPQVARQYGVQSIPLVIAFKDGAPVAEFVGAQPENVLRRFVGSLLPSEADKLTREAAELAGGGHANAAEERLRAALALDARHPSREEGARGQAEFACADTGRDHRSPGGRELGRSALGEIYLDGRMQGVSPPLLELQVVAGKHEIKIRNTTLPTYTQVIKVKSGEKIKSKHTFANERPWLIARNRSFFDAGSP